jgi:hypothetical protein
LAGVDVDVAGDGASSGDVDVYVSDVVAAGRGYRAAYGGLRVARGACGEKLHYLRFLVVHAASFLRSLI